MDALAACVASAALGYIQNLLLRECEVIQKGQLTLAAVTACLEECHVELYRSQPLKEIEMQQAFKGPGYLAGRRT